MEAGREGPHRGRLGASMIGRPCDRQLWYAFRGLVARTFSGRMLRLFETGHLEEPRFVRELKGIGCTVLDKDDKTGKQFEFVALGGHFVCHPDAAILGLPEAPATWHIGEFKTMGGEESQSKDFEKVVKEGVKQAKPEHYAQMQVEMGMSGMTRALYLCKKKATDELHAERVRFDPAEFKRLMDRAESVIRAIAPPERCATRPDDFRCRFCDAFKLCWGTGETAVPIPKKTCRSCCHATPEVDPDRSWPRWSCAKHSKDLSTDDQDRACGDHLLLPGLVSFADPTDSGPDHIEFTNTADQAVWIHGSKPGGWSTEELMKTPGPLVGQKAVQFAKDEMGAEVTEVRPMTLIEKYPPEHCKLLWEGTIEDGSAALGKASDALFAGLEKTGEQMDAKGMAYEYGGKRCVVIYPNDLYAAIWERV